MGAYLIKRLIQTIPILFGITIISFLIINLAPGSPVGMTLNPTASPKVIEQMRKNYDLDKPLHLQYLLWLKRLITGDLYSFKDGKPVLDKILERLPATLVLNFMATLLIFSLAIPLGIFSATHRYSFLDNLGTFLAFLGISIPSFWLAYLLILGVVKIFGVPVLGLRSIGLDQPGIWVLLSDRIWHLMLPATVLAVGGIAAISRYTRSSMLEVLRQDYIRTAKAKGLTDEDVHYRHALRNALLPIITLFGFLVPGLIGGSVIIETVFAWPGIGRLAYQAVLSRDYSVVMTILTLTSALTLLGNLLADILYAFTDPRIRF
ncbi:MAG TPA: ABC transporter permease [Thermodesulfobacteriota bacterium]|nr:ABC transporter permease [Thermodesulfobacteriota bacterium]